MLEIIVNLRRSPVLKQYLATFIVNIFSLSHGSAIGWLSPFLPLLQSDDSPLATGPVTIVESSWIGSILCVGGVTGTMLFGYLTEILGKKKSLLLLVVPHIAFWGFVMFGTQVYHLYIARIMAGAAGGGLMRCISLYVADIADTKVRGTLGSMMILSTNLGIFIGFTTGNFLNYHTVPLVMIALPIIYFCGILYLPDTPYCLLRKNKIQEAEESLHFYRNVIPDYTPTSVRVAVIQEFQHLKKIVEAEQSGTHENKVTWRDFVAKDGRKGMIIGIFLMVLNQFSGGFVIINFTAIIFRESGATISLTPNECSMIVAFIQIVGAYLSTILVDKTGRKILLTVSSFGTGVGLTVMGLFTYLVKTGYDLADFGWIPVTSLSFVILIASTGLLTVPFVVLAEILPQKIRSMGASICLTLIAACAFVTLKVFPILLVSIELYGCMWIFAIICFAGAIFILVIVPETKGKNLIVADSDAKTAAAVGNGKV